MAETIDRVLQSIARGSLLPCYLLYGDETFLVNDALRRVLDAFFPDGRDELSCFMLDGEAVDAETIRETVLTPSLVPGRKVVVVRGSDLFSSKTAPPPLPEPLSKLLSDDPIAAIRSFQRTIHVLGWSIDDLDDDGWRRLPADELDRLFSGTDCADDYETVLSTLISLCRESGHTEPAARIGGDDLLATVITAGLPPGMCLVMTAHAVDKRKKLFKLFSDVGAVVHFPGEKTEGARYNRVVRMVRDYLAQRGKSIAPEAMELLGERRGVDFEDIVSEIDKVLLYVGQQATRISRSDVETVVARTREESLFSLTEAIGERSPERGLRALRRLLAHNTPPPALVGMLAREIRFLLQAHLMIRAGWVSWSGSMPSYGAFRERLHPAIAERARGMKKSKIVLAGQHPYVIYHALKQCHRFSRSDLVRHLASLVETDRALKSTGIDEKLLMERLVLQLCSGRS